MCGKVLALSIYSVIGAAAWPSRPCALSARLNISRLHGRRRLWPFGSRRTDPDFKVIGIAITAIDDDDPAGIDSACGYQIIHRAFGQHVSLADATGATRIDNYVSLRVRRILQLDRQVIKPRLVLIEGHRWELIE